MVAGIFFFNDTATTEIYTLSLHDALPILHPSCAVLLRALRIRYHVPMPSARSQFWAGVRAEAPLLLDRKSTRLNSSHANISYAVFCLKKKQYSSPSYLSPSHQHSAASHLS